MAERKPSRLHDRSEERTQLFLGATLLFGTASMAVRVRDLSPTGALVEGMQLPPVGSAVWLQRGALRASATAIWVVDGRAGLSFDQPVPVAAWLSGQAEAPVAKLSPAAALFDLARLHGEIERLVDAFDPALLAAYPQLKFLASARDRITLILAALRR